MKYSQQTRLLVTSVVQCRVTKILTPVSVNHSSQQTNSCHITPGLSHTNIGRYHLPVWRQETRGDHTGQTSTSLHHVCFYCLTGITIITSSSSLDPTNYHRESENNVITRHIVQDWDHIQHRWTPTIPF